MGVKPRLTATAITMKRYFSFLLMLNLVGLLPFAHSQVELSLNPTEVSVSSDTSENSQKQTPSFLDEEHPASWKGYVSAAETQAFQTKFFNMLAILGLLIAFMIAASWALKRMMKSRISQLNAGSSIKVLETRYLSPRATLYLVQIRGELFLLGESPTALSPLAKMETQDLVD